ncbi:MAG: hypothetical protein LBK99_04435 [Opitutaceae bacterium]|jgi:hypothetical protein|nr:hypothetical protein [Opitutaceae bacterium]
MNNNKTFLPSFSLFCNLGKPSWVLLVVALFVAIAMLIPGLARHRSTSSGACAELVLSACQPGMLQIFYDRGLDFNEADSSRVSYDAGGPHTLQLELPNGIYHRLRIDPTIHAGRVTIHTLRLNTATRTGGIHIVDLADLRPLNQIGYLELSEHGLTIEATGADPYLEYKPRTSLRIGAQSSIIAWVVMLVALAWVIMLSAKLLFALAPDCDSILYTKLWLLMCLAIIALTRATGLGDPLLDWYEFRQTQTVLTAYWFNQEGFSLPDYPLPILGYPWTVPMEFPIYQIAVALLHQIGIPLDLAARGFALLCYVAACGLLAWMLLRHGCPPYLVASAGLFAWLSPFALVWSRAALIEFTAVLLGLAYVALAWRISERGHSKRGIIGFCLVGASAAATKVTSFTVFWPPVALLAFIHLRQLKTNASIASLLKSVFFWTLGLSLPLIAAIMWTHVSDEVKSLSEHTAWLTSRSLGEWNFGTFAQRLDLKNWLIIGKRVHNNVMPFLWPLTLLGVPIIFRMPIRMAAVIGGLLVGAFGTVLVFFNLYLIHDYYLCAIVLPLWVAAGAGIYLIAHKINYRAWGALVFIVIFGILGVSSIISPRVKGSYRDLSKDEIVRFSTLVREHVPFDAEVIIFGDDWNSRLPYYTQRKALMVRTPTTPSMAATYAQDRHVRYAISTPSALSQLHESFPDATNVIATGNFTLYRLP